MELAGKDIAALHRSMDFGTIPGFCHNNRGIFCLQIIGMYKINIGALFQPFKKPGSICDLKGIPAHMRDLETFSCRYLHDPAGQQAKSLHTGCLFTLIE